MTHRLRIEIRRVNNGYLALPPIESIDDEVNVFETFDALIDHLRSEFGEKPIAVIETNPRTIEVDPGLL